MSVKQLTRQHSRPALPARAVAFAVGGALLWLFPSVASGHYFEVNTSGRLYEGFATKGKHLDLTTTAKGRRVTQVVIRARNVCRGRQNGRGYRTVRSEKVVLGSGGFKVRHGRFRWNRRFRQYGYPHKYSLRGRFSNGGRTVTVSYRESLSFRNSLRVGVCRINVKLKARRFAPADYRGKTSQGLPMSFHVGAFRFDRAPVNDLRYQARLRCQNGQIITRAYNFPAPPDGTLGASTDELSGKTRFTVGSGDPDEGGFVGRLHASRRKGTYISGAFEDLSEYLKAVDPATGHPHELYCTAGEVTFKVRRKH